MDPLTCTRPIRIPNLSSVGPLQLLVQALRLNSIESNGAPRSANPAYGPLVYEAEKANDED